MRARFGDYELDKERRELRFHDAPVHVEPQVFDLLVYLVTNRDRVVSKDEMVATIWGGRIVSDVTLNSRINAVRRAIGDDGTRQAFIRTVPRRGFRFVGEVSEQPRGGIAPAQPEAAADAPSESPAPAPGARAERRQVTALACELIGIPSSRMDPEDLRDLTDACYRWIGETAAPFGGLIGRRGGTTAVVFFGYPVASEDDAEQAVRAALALGAAIGTFKAGNGPTLQCRIGIATGLVVVRDGAGVASETDTVGEPLNVAARLQALAPPNAVLIDESTKRLVGNLFDCRDLGATSGAPVWQVLAPGAFESRFEALHQDSLTPLVGREEELEILLRRWSRAKAGEGCVMQISGEPGIGKSRLALALQDAVQAEPHTRLRFFCSPHHVNSALYPIIFQLERAAQFKQGDSAQTRLDKLDAMLAETATTAENAALIAEMLSLGNDGRHPVLDLTPRERRRKQMDALVAHLRAAAEDNPVVMIFEDTQWIDPTSQELLGRMVDLSKTARVLLIITFRPEFDSPWTGKAHVTALTMNRLAERETHAMIDRIIGNGSLSAAIRKEIIERADGIPLFVEEITKAVLEAEIEASAEVAPTMIPSATLVVPASLHASLMARLDRLGSAKEVAQIGSTIGREFSDALLAAAAGRPEAELRAALDRLVAAGLLFRQGVPPYGTYVFKHALVQDAAYGSLTRDRRRQLHGDIAAAIQAAFPETARDEPELLAIHLLNAEKHAEALPQILGAARLFTRRYSYVEALRWFERGAQILSQLPVDQRDQRLELELYLEWTPVLMTISGYTDQQTLAVAKHADALARKLNVVDKLLPALFAQASFYGAGGGPLNEGIEFAGRMIHLGEETRDPIALMMGHRFAGFCLLWQGRFEEAEDQLTRALERARSTPKGLGEQFGQDPEITSLVLLGSAKQLVGLADEGERLMRKALASARELKHPMTLAYVLRHYLIFAALLKNYPIVENLSEELNGVCLKYQIRQWIHLGPLMMAWARFRGPQDMDAIAALQSLLEQHRAAGFRRNLPFYLMLVAEPLGNSGNREQASALLDDAHSLMLQLNETWIESYLREVAAELQYS